MGEHAFPDSATTRYRLDPDTGTLEPVTSPGQILSSDMANAFWDGVLEGAPGVAYLVEEGPADRRPHLFLNDTGRSIRVGSPVEEGELVHPPDTNPPGQHEELKEEVRRLSEENRRLRNELAAYKRAPQEKAEAAQGDKYEKEALRDTYERFSRLDLD